MRKKQVECPKCGFKRLVDANITVRIEAYEENEMPLNWNPDYFIKCKKCRHQIGLRTAS